MNRYIVLKTSPFPPVNVKRLREFYDELCEFDLRQQ